MPDIRCPGEEATMILTHCRLPLLQSAPSGPSALQIARTTPTLLRKGPRAPSRNQRELSTRPSTA